MTIMGQNEANEATAVADTVTSNEKYGLRLGVDLSKLLRTAFDDNFSGFEIQGDFRVSKKFFAAVELGNEEREWDEENLNAIAKGSFAKVGFDYNAYNNWLGMNNAITVGLRYGFSTFSQELLSYEVTQTTQTIPTEIRIDPQEFNDLNAHWAELILAVKAELINNLYLSLNVQLKRLVSEKKPDNFDNLIIPGFNRTNDFSEFGVGYGYTLSYLIPIFKK